MGFQHGGKAGCDAESHQGKLVGEVHGMFLQRLGEGYFAFGEREEKPIAESQLCL